MRRFFYWPLIVFFAFPFLFLRDAAARDRNRPFVVESEFFTIQGYPGLEIQPVLEKANFNYFLHLDDLPLETGNDAEQLLARSMDALYLEISDILSISAYSFRGVIEILPDQAAVAQAFYKEFGRDYPERSFYLHEKKTIYISFKDFTVGMLGHEIAHAIISHYFVIPPPPKVQEVLSGYVEYTLRKKTATLP